MYNIKGSNSLCHQVYTLEQKNVVAYTTFYSSLYPRGLELDPDADEMPKSSNGGKGLWGPMAKSKALRKAQLAQFVSELLDFHSIYALKTITTNLVYKYIPCFLADLAYSSSISPRMAMRVSVL